jgi:hypothetical protein
MDSITFLTCTRKASSGSTPAELEKQLFRTLLRNSDERNVAGCIKALVFG